MVKHFILVFALLIADTGIVCAEVDSAQLFIRMGFTAVSLSKTLPVPVQGSGFIPANRCYLTVFTHHTPNTVHLH